MLRRFPYLRTLAPVCILSLTIQGAAPLFASSSTRGGVEKTVSTLSTDNIASSTKLLGWANGRRDIVFQRAG